MTDKNNEGSASRYSRMLLARNIGLLTVMILITAIVLGCKTCSQPEPEPAQEGKGVLGGGAMVCPSAEPREKMPEGHPPVGGQSMPMGGHKIADAPAAQMLQGTVVETMQASRYTYVRVEDSSGAKHWVAAPVFKVKVGDEIMVPTGMQMKDFYSKTLDKKFDFVYFAGGVKKIENLK